MAHPALAAVRGHALVDLPAVAAAALAWPWCGWPGAVLAGAVAVGLHAGAVVSPGWGLYLSAATRVTATGPGGLVALTFDDGPDPEVTPAVLDALAARRATATFFVIGSHATGQGPLLRRMHAEGHSLGLHSWDHRWHFAVGRPARICADLARCRAVVEDAVGGPVRLFRPPAGITTPLLAAAVAATDLVTVAWARRGGDGMRLRAGTAFRRLAACAAGDIAVLHDGTPPGAAARDRRDLPGLVGDLLDAWAGGGLASGALTTGPDGRLEWR